ncbi:MAG: leucine-rich repeat protein, partial [Prevotellaceae bacterium]|nr:leucine-rich repeat protein [Prevotellaceae bacterium]
MTIPESVTSIGNNAFDYCTSLISVTCLAENVPEMGSNVFAAVPQSEVTLYVPESALEAYKAAELWKYFGRILPIGADDPNTPDTPKLPVVKMTYVDYYSPDTPVGEVDVAQAGYNKMANGEVGFGNTAWNCNWITYVSVDASGIDGAAIKSVRLTADVYGSTDSKRNTTWGVGYNASGWSADMTYSTADKSITLIGTEFTTVTKAADIFETVTFDITPAFANGSRTATILVYETAAAGGYIKNVKVEVETADSELDAAKERAIAAVRALPAGEGLFRYSQEDIDAAIAAIEAAQTVEEVEAVAMPSVKLPAEDQAYLLSLATSEGTFSLNTDEGIKIAKEGTPVFLVAQDNGTYAIATLNGEYVNYAGGNEWTLTATADAYGWTIAALADGGYTITGKNGFLGTNTSDGNAAGSTCYGDKKSSNGNYIWNIEETEIPAP